MCWTILGQFPSETWTSKVNYDFWNLFNFAKPLSKVQIYTSYSCWIGCQYQVITRCSTQSPPASSVMDFIFCDRDSSHVSVDTVNPSLVWASSSTPWRYHLQRLSSDLVLVSALHISNPFSPPFLHHCIMTSSFSLFRI